MEVDQNYRRLYSYVEVIMALVRSFFEGDWDAAVRWDTLALVPTNQIAPDLSERENDLMWEVTRRDAFEACIYRMVEFQSTADSTMALGMNTYTALLKEGLGKEPLKGRKREFALVAPVVVYTGSEPWTAVTDLDELTPEWPEALPGTVRYGQRMRYLLQSAQHQEGGRSFAAESGGRDVPHRGLGEPEEVEEHDGLDGCGIGACGERAVDGGHAGVV